MDQRFWKIAALTVITIAGTGIIIWMSKNAGSISRPKRKKKNLRRKDIDYLQNSAAWEKVGKVKNIWIYPVKSCAGINVKEALMEKVGPRSGDCRDRSLVVINQNGDMITGRKVSSTVLITPEFDYSNSSITLKFPHLQPIKIYLSLIEIEGNIVEAKIWDDIVSGFDCGDEAADWLTLALGCKCRLLYHGSLMSRRTTERHVTDFPFMNSDDNSLYADLNGFMLINEASILDLEKKTIRKLSPQNFRPNLLVEGPVPYDEDDWTYVKIGEALFRNTKPCWRCVFATIDYRTGKRDPKMEPLKTLKRYRCPVGSNSPEFGINMGVDKVGKVRMGDDIFVLRD